jgi:glycosyltransferase involved in cell wall biosynthesis
MMKIFLNALGASCASGVTYLRNVIPHLSARAGLRTVVAVNPQLRPELGNPESVSFLDVDIPASPARRFWFEQAALPKLIRQNGTDVLVSAGNIALRWSPVPQILLSGNSLYTSSDFSRDLRRRRDYGLWLDNRIKGFFARRSIDWADATVAPSQTFARELQRKTGARVLSIYHGFDCGVFFGDSAPLPAEVREKLDSTGGALRLLFVSHYNYYRNFETLLRAVPILQEHLAGQKVRLFLTCKLSSAENPGTYRADAAAALVKQLGIEEQVVELGAIPYSQLHHVYQACDIYVSPAYAETFAHPLVEAMASGLPVVASDLEVHREVCGGAALYFPCFSPAELSDQVVRIATSASLRQKLTHWGAVRSRDFSWAEHVDELLQLATQLMRSPMSSFTEARLIA